MNPCPSISDYRYTQLENIFENKKKLSDVPVQDRTKVATIIHGIWEKLADHIPDNSFLAVQSYSPFSTPLSCANSFISRIAGNAVTTSIFLEAVKKVGLPHSAAPIVSAFSGNSLSPITDNCAPLLNTKWIGELPQEVLLPIIAPAIKPIWETVCANLNIDPLTVKGQTPSNSHPTHVFMRILSEGKTCKDLLDAIEQSELYEKPLSPSDYGKLINCLQSTEIKDDLMKNMIPEEKSRISKLLAPIISTLYQEFLSERLDPRTPLPWRAFMDTMCARPNSTYRSFYSEIVQILENLESQQKKIEAYTPTDSEYTKDLEVTVNTKNHEILQLQKNLKRAREELAERKGSSNTEMLLNQTYQTIGDQALKFKEVDHSPQIPSKQTNPEGTVKEFAQKLLEMAECPISLDAPTPDKAIVGSDGIVYDIDAYTLWTKNNTTSPVTRETLDKSYPCFPLRNILSALQKVANA